MISLSNFMLDHNALHAADVLHAVSFMISCESVAKHRTAFDTLCVFVGAIVHDHGRLTYYLLLLP